MCHHSRFDSSSAPLTSTKRREAWAIGVGANIGSAGKAQHGGCVEASAEIRCGTRSDTISTALSRWHWIGAHLATCIATFAPLVYSGVHGCRRVSAHWTPWRRQQGTKLRASYNVAPAAAQRNAAHHGQFSAVQRRSFSTSPNLMQ